MAEGDCVVMQKSSLKHFQHLMARVCEHYGSVVLGCKTADISDSTYYRMMDGEKITKLTAQKIADAYAQIAPYNQKAKNNAKAA